MVRWRSDWPRWVATSAGVALVALAVAVLVAWHFHFIPLIRILPNSAPMHRMTALEFMLAGIAICLAANDKQRAARAFAVLMLIMPVLAALEYMLKTSFGIDQLLGRDYLSPPTSPPGRSSPATVACFIAGGFSLLALSRPTASWSQRTLPIVGILASMLVAVGTIIVLAYLGHSQAFGWGTLGSSALHTGAGQALIGVGLLALAWRQRTEAEGLPKWVPVGLALGLSIAALGT